jgi:hypothetical protein
MDPKSSSTPQLVFDVDDGLKSTLEAQKNWGGIVGFFHPFWYVLSIPHRHEPFADVRQAMLEVAESESYGRLFVRHKTVGLMPSAAFIREIMK